MLRQLARLTRRVPAAGPRALAVAVYADAADAIQPASQAGFEGVACVDDAARACTLLCDLWASTRAPWIRAWAEGLLDFLLWMHEGGGRWVNFISDWDGSRNDAGRTSAPGVNFWQARATLAMAKAAVVLDDRRAAEQVELGMAAADGVPAAADVRAVHAMAALELVAGTPHWSHQARLERWCDEIAQCKSGETLINWPLEQGPPHLWGHIQEGVLAEAGAALARGDLIAVARRSADVVFPEVIESGFDLDRVLPYDVQSSVYAMDRLAAVTGEPAYSALGRQARMWFDGRNPGRCQVYDRARGRVADGVDLRQMSRHSGAESNIVACQALFEDAVLLAHQLTAGGGLHLPPLEGEGRGGGIG